MNRIQVFNVQNKLDDGRVVNQDLLTEQQVLEQLEKNSSMESEDINFAIQRMKKTSETLFIETKNGKLYFNITEAVLH